jgi:cyclopropane fatty-acyl-phospholipid synthase-like methyltransferase
LRKIYGWLSGARRHLLVGPPHLWKEKREFQIRFLRQEGLEPRHYLLDLGCGTLRGGIPLIEYLEPGHYYGVDVRDQALEEGRKELREAGLEHKNPVLERRDRLSSADMGREFDFIWAFAVLIHMSDDVLAHCLDFAGRHLKNGGRFYANAMVGKRFEHRLLRWREFPVVRRPAEFYEDMAARSGLSVGDAGPLSSRGHPLTSLLRVDNRMLVFRKR